MNHHRLFVSLSIAFLFLMNCLVPLSGKEASTIPQRMVQGALEKAKRLLQFEIILIPEVIPAEVCKAYQDGTKGRLSCECWDSIGEPFGLIEDDKKGVVAKCRDNQVTCNDENSTICFEQTYTTVLSGEEETKNNITQHEICTNFTSTNYTYWESQEMDTPLNVSGHVVCVTLFPCVVGTFDTLCDCTATMDGDNCFRCNICEETRISLDCCNVELDFRSTCGPTGEGGAYAPYFDLVSEPGYCEASTAWSRKAHHSLFTFLVLATSSVVAILCTFG